MAVDQELTGEDAQYDYRDFIADVDDNEGFEFISADKQQLEKARAMMAPAFQGGRKQVDKKVNEMTADEREVFETLDGDEVNDFRLPGYEVYGEQKAESKLRVPKEKVTYEAIADDLIAQLNGGMPALDKAGPEPVRKEPQPSTGGMPMARIDNYKERMEGVLAMLEKAEEFKGAGFLLAVAFKIDGRTPPDKVQTVKDWKKMMADLDKLKAASKPDQAKDAYAKAKVTMDVYLDSVELPLLGDARYSAA